AAVPFSPPPTGGASMQAMSVSRHKTLCSRLGGALGTGVIVAGMLALGPSGCGDSEGPDAPDATSGGPDSRPDAVPVHVQLLAFNDFHGNIEPPAGSGGRIQVGTLASGDPEFVDAGGAMYFARHIASMRAEQPNTVVVSAGDLIGASPLISALFHDEPTIEA